MGSLVAQSFRRVTTLAALALALAPVAAHATTFTLTSTADAVDASPGNGTCATAGAACTLRAAVQEANAHAGADTIDVPAGTYQLTIAGTDDTAAAGDLDVTGPLTIVGTSAGAPSDTTIEAGTNLFNGIDRIFSFNPGGASSAGFAVSLSNLTLTFGRPVSGMGGAFDFDAGSSGGGSLSLTNSEIDSNSTAADNGGGIALLDGGTVTITGTGFQSNRAGIFSADTGRGGAIYVGMPQGIAHRNLTITGANVFGNQSANAGGGIAFDGPDNPSAVVNDQISSSFLGANLAGSSGGHFDGGAVFIGASPAATTFDRDTFSSNFTQADGGAIAATTSGATTIQHSQLIGNSAGASSGSGGAIALGAGTATVAFDRIVNNTASTGTGVAKDDNPGTATLTNDWWGCNDGPTLAPCDTAVKTAGGSGGGTLAIPDWLTLHASAAPATIAKGATSTIQGDLLTNSAGAAVAPSDLSTFDNMTVGFGNVQHGSVSLPGVGFASGAATTTFTAGGGGTGSVDVSFDHATATASVDILAAANLEPFVVASTLDPVIAGSNGGTDNLVYTVTLANTGGDTVTSAQAIGTLTLPAGVTASVTTSDGTAVYDSGTGAITWTVGTLAPGTATMLVHVNVSGTAADGATISLSETSSLSSPAETDTNPADDTASATSTVQGAAIVTANPAGGLDFGTQRSGTVSLIKDIFITNTGVTPLHITGASLAGGAVQFDYTLVSDGCAGQTLPPGVGASCTIQVQFMPHGSRAFPGGVGVMAASISLATDAPTSPDLIPLTGTGTAAIFSASPGPFDFGDQRAQTPSAPQAFTITNVGTAPLDIPAGGVTLTGADTSSFGITSDQCSGQALAPSGGSCEVDVRFAPISPGAKSVSIDVVSDAQISPDDIPLTGNGTAAVFAAAPSAKDFGDERVGTNSATQTFTVTNTGAAPLDIPAGGAFLTGADPGQFELVSNGCDGQTLAPSGGSCDIVMRFDPTATGAKSARIEVDSDTLTTPDTIALTGNGVVSTFISSPPAKDFGSVPRDATSAPQTFTITNPGTAPLDVSTVTLGGADPSQFTLVTNGCDGQALAPGAASCQLVVRFFPTSLGAKQASLEINSDAPSTPDHIALSGTSTQPVPIVATGAASDITTTGATLNGTVDALLGATTAHFDYGTSTAYGASTPDASAGSNGVVSVSAALTGLKPNTTYHFRLVAHNDGGTTTGDDVTFRTAANPPSSGPGPGGTQGPPHTTIPSPPRHFNHSRSVRFHFHANQAGATFECRLVRNGRGGRYRPCPATYTLKGLTVGHYALQVRAVGAGGKRDPHPISYRFTVDFAGPIVRLGTDPVTVDANGDFTLLLNCIEGSGQCSTTISLTAPDHGQAIAIAHRTLTLKANGRQRVTLRLTAQGRALLASAHTLQATVRVTAADGAKNFTVLVTRRTLRSG